MHKLYRIIIGPSPGYTEAAEQFPEQKDLTAKSYGELVEGSKYFFISNIIKIFSLECKSFFSPDD